MAAFRLHKMTDQSQAQCSVKMLESVSAVKSFKSGAGSSSRVAESTSGNAPAPTVNTGHMKSVGKTPQHDQVLAVVLSVDTEEGAKVMDDFEHLRSKSCLK